MTNFSVEKWCHLPSPTRYCVCAPACPHWTGGSKEDSILLPALSCSPLFSEGRIVFGPLWTGRKSRAMVCLCVWERKEGYCPFHYACMLSFSQGQSKPQWLLWTGFKCLAGWSFEFFDAAAKTVPEFWSEPKISVKCWDNTDTCPDKLFFFFFFWVFFSILKLVCCEASQIFCGIWNFPWLFIGMRVSKWSLNFNFG